MAYLRWGPLYRTAREANDPDVVAALARSLEDGICRQKKALPAHPAQRFCRNAARRSHPGRFGSFTPEPLGADNTYRTFVVDLSPSI